MRDRQRAVAADHDERVEAHLVEHLDEASGVVAVPSDVAIGYANGLPRLVVPRIVPPRRRMPRDVPRRERPRAVGLDEPVEAVLEADALDAGVVRRLDDGADDGVEAGRVAAAGEDADSS